MTIPDSHKSSTGAPGEVLQQTKLELLQSMFQLLRLLLDGEPVSVGRFAAATTRSLTEAETIFARLRAWGAEFDAAGDFTGAGVTLVPTPHHYTVNSRHFSIRGVRPIPCSFRSCSDIRQSSNRPTQ